MQEESPPSSAFIREGGIKARYEVASDKGKPPQPELSEWCARFDKTLPGLTLITFHTYKTSLRLIRRFAGGFAL